MVKKATAKLKNKRASDRLGWRAEWLKVGGEEIVKRFYLTGQKKNKEYNEGKQQSKAYIKVVIRPT